MNNKEEKKSIKKNVTEVSQTERKKLSKKPRMKKHVKMTTLSSRIIILTRPTNESKISRCAL